MAWCVLTGLHSRAPEILKIWKSGNLEIWKPGIPSRARRARDSAEVPPFAAGMGVGIQRPKRLEKLRIWRSGAARRAGVGVRRGRPPGCRRGWGGRISEIQVFGERTLGNLRWGSLVDHKAAAQTIEAEGNFRSRRVVSRHKKPRSVAGFFYKNLEE